jgi:hypothetical protein
MFLLTFSPLGLNILLVRAESAKADAEKIRKQRRTTGTHDIILSENKATENTAVVFVLE